MNVKAKRRTQKRSKNNPKKADFNTCYIYYNIIFNVLDVFHNFHSENRRFFYIVKKYTNGYMNIINASGNLLLDDWYPQITFEHAYHYPNSLKKTGYGVITRSDKLKTVVREDGRILSKDWFTDIGPFIDGFCQVTNTKGLCNLLRFDGSYVQEKWVSPMEIEKLRETFKGTFHGTYYKK